MGTRPRVYYKRSTDGNVWNNNTNATDGWKYVEATNTTTPFNFVFNYNLLNFGGINVGQVIEYFVVAQDMVATPNISINSGTFNSAPATVNLTTAAFPVSATNSHTVVNALPTYMTVGAFGDFATFTPAGGLFNVINNVGLSDNTTIEIIDALLTENNSQPLNQIHNTGCSSGAVTLLIKPAAGVNAVITANINSNSVMRIFSSNVTIDGSNNGTTSRNLTIRNTSTLDPVVIWYGSTGTVPINNSTLKNTICNNGAITTSTVVVSDGGVGGGQGYFNNITIQNNSILKGSIGLQCAAFPSTGNGSIHITRNDLNATASNRIGAVGIYAEGLDGATISNNNIGNFESAVVTARYGIWMGSNTINSTISGNTISGISYVGSGGPLTYGIYAVPMVAASNNNITGNTISNITSGSSSAVYGIGLPASAGGGITIQKNNISNIKNTNALAGGAYGVGIFSTLTTTNTTIANNFIYDIAGVGAATVVRNGHGIILGAGGGYKIYYNSINMNANQTNISAGLSAALTIHGVITPLSVEVRNNIFANNQTGGQPVSARYAIYSTNANTIFSAIDYNDYYTATGTNLGFIAGTTLAGISDIRSGFTGNVNSLNVLPGFVSSTDLHLNANAVNCPLDDKGTPIAGFMEDIDGDTHNSSTPDMGADEFTALSGSLSGIAGTAVCSNKPVVNTGTTYTQAANCNLIAKVLPSGLDPVTGNINTCVTLDATQQYFNGEPYVQRHFDIEPSSGNQTTTSAKITLYFTNTEFVNYNTLNSPVWPPLPTVAGGANSDPNRANVKITQFHGVATTSPSTPGNYPGVRVLINPGAANVFWNGSYWEITFSVTGFSGFYVHTNFANTPLPVAVNYLTGKRSGNNHLLNWKVTCTGSAGVTMTLERSADARNFTGIHTIAATALRCQQPFDHTDTDPLKGMNYYRIKIIDADGKITYSTTVALLNAVKGFDIISIAPNPVVDDNFKLNVASAQAGKMDIAIFDMQGRLVNTQTVSLVAGFNSLPVNIASLAPGSYTIRAATPDEQTKIIRFIKQ